VDDKNDDKNNDKSTDLNTTPEAADQLGRVDAVDQGYMVSAAQPQPQPQPQYAAPYAAQYAAPQGAPQQVFSAPAPPKKNNRRRNTFFFIGGATALALCMGGGGIALGASIAASNYSTAIAASGTSTVDPGSFLPGSPSGTDSGDSSTDSGTGTDSSTDSGTTDGSTTTPFGGSQGGFGDRFDAGSGSGSTGTGTATTQSAATAATDDQQVGVVTILTDLYFDDASQAAGTGIVLTSSGTILTNNHVIEGATTIEVTIESTGKTYEATVVGTDATDDVAVLQLSDVSGLETATIDEDDLAVADEVTSIGNAQGTGDLVAAAGTVTALDQDITVGSETSDTSESLTGLIQIDAAVVSGDSGGPLVDSEGEVTGIVTAASSGSAVITGYAIPIAFALDIADQILAGDESGNVELGVPAFLGVQLATEQGTTGVLLGGVIDDTAAAAAGLVAGDTITSFDGTTVTTATELSAAVAAKEIGDTVSITYTDTAGATQTVTATLMAGPAS
jgi:S1-C subfamily serine protease